MTAQTLRERYIQFFLSKEHAEISGKSVIPDNDPSALFTTAGMHPLVPYLLGQEHPAGKRLVGVQKCIRTQDIDLVGDSSHLTFFEMLGNWSLRDYGKKEAITWSYEFLTSTIYLGLDPKRLSVTIFAGDQDVPRDTESEELWRELGFPPNRIFALGREDNWWIADETGPCGPDTEMFYDTEKSLCSPHCCPGCSCGKYLEIWNDVFMQYERLADRRYRPLNRLCVDTGMGIERTITILQGKESVYETELFTPLIEVIASLCHNPYGEDEQRDRSFRILADHTKAAIMILGDERGVKPSNLGQGYVLRKLIRRAVREGLKLGVQNAFLAKLVPSVLSIYRKSYTALVKQEALISTELTLEETLFHKTLSQGRKEFEKRLPSLLKNPKKIVPGRIAFTLYDTFGLPLEATEDLAKEHAMVVDHEGFQKAFSQHQKASMGGDHKTFKGGLADTSIMATRYHTVTHLLHEALRRILGPHVAQKGSNITVERLRFDFAHTDRLTDEQIAQVETLVNEAIEKNPPISVQEMSLEEARALGARALFEGKYSERVNVYSIGDFSREVCGGPHVSSLQGIGTFKIMKEQSISRGTRRVRAILIPPPPIDSR